MPAPVSFSDFEELLVRRLDGPLPGREAHLKMAAAHYRNWPGPQESTRASAVLVLFYPDQDEIVFPVIRRPAYDGVHSGQIAFPGGKADPEDENLCYTALREAWEEVSAPREEIRILGRLSEIYITVSDLRVVPVIGSLPYRPSLSPDPREVQDIVEIRLSEIRDRVLVREGKIPVRGGYVLAPFYDYRGLQIWGATAMMISELLDIIDT